MESHKLLIVDDEIEIRKTYSDYFTKRGFIVDTAADGVAGLNKLLHDEFDVALVDIKMPKMDGLEMIRQALSGDPVDANIIILTGSGDREDAVKAINYGANAWFDKTDNLDMSQLFQRVSELSEVVPIDTIKRLLAITRKAEASI